MHPSRSLPLRAALTAGVVLGALAPAASAKVFFPMRDHVLTVGTSVRLEVPGCDTGGAGCVASYPGPARIYLVRAEVPIPFSAAETAEPPKPSRALGRLGGRGILRFVPHAPGRFRLVALLTVGIGDDLRTVRMPVSPVFVVHPRA